MNFSFYLLKSFRFLLFPFSLIYGSIIVIRNFLFDKNIIKSISFDLPVIAVGNLSTGGTGKSPMAEYLISLLKEKYSIAVISRGYKRKTKGFVLANAASTALEIGDEPMQFHEKFPDISVAVGEERIVAIPKLLQDKPDTNVIILDDAFQHRRVKPEFNIVLTAYGNLFTDDFFLPTGNLRDQRSSYKRADIIIVTKCPADLSLSEKNAIEDKIKPLPFQRIFFSTLIYGDPYHITDKSERMITPNDGVLLACGIANPASTKNYLMQKAKAYKQLIFSDHHNFTDNDIVKMRKKFETINSDQKMIITTEKDAVKLAAFKEKLQYIPLYVLPVKTGFLFNEGRQFNNIINSFTDTFLRNKDKI